MSNQSELDGLVMNSDNEPLELVKLTWMDSAGRDGVIWHFKDEVSDIRATICRSVGYLISEDEDTTLICQHVNEDQYGRVFAIPTKSIIRKMTVLPQPSGEEK